MWGGAAAGAMGGAAAAANHQLPVIQSHVNTLVDMGFTREFGYFKNYSINLYTFKAILQQINIELLFRILY